MNIDSATAGVASGTCIEDQLWLRSNAGSQYITFSIDPHLKGEKCIKKILPPF
jgi:hypothetical protein